MGLLHKYQRSAYVRVRFSRSPWVPQGTKPLRSAWTTYVHYVEFQPTFLGIFRTGNLYKDHLCQSDTQRSSRPQHHRSSMHTPFQVQAFRASPSWWFPARAFYTAVEKTPCARLSIGGYPGEYQGVPHLAQVCANGKRDRFDKIIF